MAQFDVYRLRSGGLVLDCQCGIVSDLVITRFVVPLFHPDAVPRTMKALHPLLETPDGDRLMATQLATAVQVKDLSQPIGNLQNQRYTITNALDFLITGV